MTKKEFKKLEEGDNLVVTGGRFVHFYPIGEIVEVEHINKKENLVTCISTVDRKKQYLCRKDLTLIRR